MAAEIIVRGEGEARAMPDRATIRIVIDGEATQRDAAYAIAAERATAADRVLEQYADAIERSITAGVVVQPTTRFRKGETQRTGWIASRGAVVTVADLERVGALIGALGESEATVYGPSWQLDARHPAYDDARREAARDAHRRAQAYAEALAVQLGPVAWAAEPGLRDGSGGGGAPMYARAMMAAGAPMEADMIAVSADEITVTAALEVGYTISD